MDSNDAWKMQSSSLARRSFLLNGVVPPPDLLSPKIVDSWKRCQFLGVSNNQRPCLDPISTQEIRLRSERDHTLIAASAVELRHLSDALLQTGHVVLSVDDQGFIVAAGGDIAGSGPILRRARAGVNVGEHNLGTTAPSVAFIEREPIAIQRAEHFLSSMQLFECVAAPVLLPNGDAIGTLCISTDTRPLLPGLMELLQNTMKRIERRLMQSVRSAGLLRIHPHPDCLGSSLEGLIALGEAGQIVGLNSLAAQFLGVDQSAAIGAPIERLLHGSASAQNARAPLMLQSQTGLRLFARLEGKAVYPSPVVQRESSVPPTTAETASIVAESFTGQELKVLRHLEAGLSNKQIGVALFISQNTVKYHLKNIFSKLHVKSRLEAIAKARRLI